MKNKNELIQKLFFERDRKSIKSDYGKALILGGSLRYPLSVLISESFASLSGCGYVGLGVSRPVYPIVASRASLRCIFEPGAVESDCLVYSKEDLDRMLSFYSCILFGNGIALNKENKDLLLYLLKNYTGNLIIDAGGLSLLDEISIDFRPRVLLTPHLGEANRLFHKNQHSREGQDYFDCAKSYAISHHCNILLKSYVSYLVNQSGEIKVGCRVSSQSLAKAGSGDGLGGYLCGLLSYSDKIIGYDDSILLADEILHQAAHLSQQENSIGLADILSAKEKIKKIVLASKKESEND